MSPLKEWYTAAELAGMPGMPGTERGVNKMGERGEIARRARERGKGWEYAQSSLPAATRNHLLRQAVAALPAPVPPPVAELPSLGELADWQREILNARLTVCACLDEVMARTGQSARAAIAAFVTSAASGALDAQILNALRAANARAGRGGRLAEAATLQAGARPAGRVRWRSRRRPRNRR